MLCRFVCETVELRALYDTTKLCVYFVRIVQFVECAFRLNSECTSVTSRINHIIRILVMLCVTVTELITPREFEWIRPTASTTISI